ncbi:hypothetical protein ACFLX5_02765 [Chloroflexota bacterium]
MAVLISTVAGINASDKGLGEAFKLRDEKFNKIPGFEVIKRPVR